MGKTIMAIGAHHDDIELRAGGTIAKYAKEGWDVIYAIACTTPHYNPSPEQVNTGKYLSTNEVIQLRKKEASEGAKILGVSSVHFLDYKSLYWYRKGTKDRVYLDGINCTSWDLTYLEQNIPGREFIVSAGRVEQAVQFMADFICGHKADIVLTHSADDVHWEHYATANLVFNAIERVGGKRKINLYGWRFGSSGTMHFSFNPTRFVDITDTIDAKTEALRVFKSQTSKNNTEKFAASARDIAKKYGRLCGYEYAEPFLDFNTEVRNARSEMIVPENYVAPAVIKDLE